MPSPQARLTHFRGMSNVRVNGMTCAHELADDSDVTIFYDLAPEHSTSSTATAIWHVYLVDPNDSDVLRWSTVTLEQLIDISKKEETAGVYCVRGIELYRRGPALMPTWAEIPPYFRMLSGPEISHFPGVVWGYEIEAPVAEMAKYLPWLRAETERKGVFFERRRLRSLSEVPATFDTVINCSGLGARELVGDAELSGVRGQYLLVRTPEGDPGLYVGDDQNPRGMSYMIPRRDGICVGGTEEHGIEDLAFTEDAMTLISRAAETAPSLRNVKADDVLARVVGIRPFRPSGVRLEADQLEDGRTVIHNYGHGGSGFSLAWGCAEDVVRLVRHSK